VQGGGREGAPEGQALLEKCGSSTGDSQQEKNLTQMCLCLNGETRDRVGQAL
jgi:hypothetical protein